MKDYAEKGHAEKGHIDKAEKQGNIQCELEDEIQEIKVCRDQRLKQFRDEKDKLEWDFKEREDALLSQVKSHTRRLQCVQSKQW